MLVIAASDSGGSGRTVTAANIAYRSALAGYDVCYVDFDLASPTAGDIFGVPGVSTGAREAGVHDYLQRRVAEPRMYDVWSCARRPLLPGRSRLFGGQGRLCLVPGTRSGGSVPVGPGVVRACADLLLAMEREFDMCVVDASAGRSLALETLMEATGLAEMQEVRTQWLVFHRLTPRAVAAAADLAFGDFGLVDRGVLTGRDPARMRESVRFVPTAVLDAAGLARVAPERREWAGHFQDEAWGLAARRGVGGRMSLGSIPFDPLLCLSEQILTDSDVGVMGRAAPATVAAFRALAHRVADRGLDHRGPPVAVTPDGVLDHVLPVVVPLLRREVERSVGEACPRR